MDTETLVKAYSAWLEIEIGLDSQAIALSHVERTKLFEQRIDQGLAALERACPGVRSKLEVFPGRPFAFTGSLTEEEIRAIWPLPELRMLSDQNALRTTEPQRDEQGHFPFIVIVKMHIQAEGSSVVQVERINLLTRSIDEATAMVNAEEQCSGSMPTYFMGSDFLIYRRWWTAEHAHLNTLREEERETFGTTTILRWESTRKKRAPMWRTDASIERVAYGSPKQRPDSWKHMIA